MATTTLCHPWTTSTGTSPPTTTFPTAVRLAAIVMLRRLDSRASSPCMKPFRGKEKAFAHIVKVGRTQLQDAVLTTLGREMGAYAECVNRDRGGQQVQERLRVVNLAARQSAAGWALPASSSSGRWTNSRPHGDRVRAR